MAVLLSSQFCWQQLKPILNISEIWKPLVCQYSSTCAASDQQENKQIQANKQELKSSFGAVVVQTVFVILLSDYFRRRYCELNALKKYIFLVCSKKQFIKYSMQLFLLLLLSLKMFRLLACVFVFSFCFSSSTYKSFDILFIYADD